MFYHNNKNVLSRKKNLSNHEYILNAHTDVFLIA